METVSRRWRSAARQCAALSLCLLGTTPVLAKDWQLGETNRDPNRTMVVFVQWTKNNSTFATEPLTELKPGETKNFTPPKGATDWIQTSFFRTGDPNKSTVKGLVLEKGNTQAPGYRVGGIRELMDTLPYNQPLPVPDPFSPGVDLFAGVDLATYLPHALTSLPSSLSITNGLSPLLPGYLIGTSEVRFDETSGLVTGNPFTGTVTFDASHLVTAVPEPEAAEVLLVGVLALTGLGWMRRRLPRADMGRFAV